MSVCKRRCLFVRNINDCGADGFSKNNDYIEAPRLYYILSCHGILRGIRILFKVSGARAQERT